MQLYQNLYFFFQMNQYVGISDNTSASFCEKMALDVILLEDDLVKVLLSVISGCC